MTERYIGMEAEKTPFWKKFPLIEPKQREEQHRERGEKKCKGANRDQKAEYVVYLHRQTAYPIKHISLALEYFIVQNSNKQATLFWCHCQSFGEGLYLTKYQLNTNEHSVI